MDETTKQQNDGRRANGWRLSKDVPISLVIFIGMQTLAFTWFMAGLSGKLTAVIEDNAMSKGVQYTKEDARHEREFMDQKFLLLQNKSDEEIRRISLLESQVNELKARLAK